MRHALMIGIIVALFVIIGTICYDGISCRVFAGQPTEAPADQSVLVNNDDIPVPETVATAQLVADGACCVRCKAIRCKSTRRCAGTCRCQVVERQVVSRPARQPLFASFAERLCAKKRVKSCSPCTPCAPVVEAPVMEAPVTAAPVVEAVPDCGCKAVKEDCRCRGRCRCQADVKVNVRVRVR